MTTMAKGVTFTSQLRYLFTGGTASENASEEIKFLLLSLTTVISTRKRRNCALSSISALHSIDYRRNGAETITIRSIARQASAVGQA